MFSRNEEAAGHLASDYPLLLVHVLVRLDRRKDPAGREAEAGGAARRRNPVGVLEDGAEEGAEGAAEGVTEVAVRRAAAGSGEKGRSAEMQRLGQGLERLLGLGGSEDDL
jgi:hypothetical protein